MKYLGKAFVYSVTKGVGVHKYWEQSKHQRPKGRGIISLTRLAKMWLSSAVRGGWTCLRDLELRKVDLELLAGIPLRLLSLLSIPIVDSETRIPFASRLPLPFRIFLPRALPTKTKVERETSQCKSWTSVNSSNSGEPRLNNTKFGSISTVSILHPGTWLCTPAIVERHLNGSSCSLGADCVPQRLRRERCTEKIRQRWAYKKH